MKKVLVTLKDGSKVYGDEFDAKDFEQLKVIFKKWQNIKFTALI